MQFELEDGMIAIILTVLNEQPARLVLGVVNELNRQKAAHEANEWEKKYGTTDKAKDTREAVANELLATVDTPVGVLES